MKRLDAPALPRFRRPPDLVYAANERPSRGALAGLAAQHAATALALLAYVLAAAKIADLDMDATRSMVTATILGMALATFFQAWGGRLGSGLTLIHIPDALLVVTSGLVASQYGAGGLVMVGLVNGLVALAASHLMPRLRAALPPTVAGVVICVAGLALTQPALIQATGLSDQGVPDGTSTLIGASTLAVIISLSIWGSTRGKLLALLAGLATGIVLAGALGTLHGLSTLAHAPVFGLPTLPIPVFGVDPGILLAVALLALMTQLDTFGSAVLMHKMNDADWRRPDMRLVAGGIRANALGNLLGAWLGAQPTATSSANIALCHISRSTSRWIGIATALLLGCCAFLPQLSLALTLIPTAVIGAVSLYAAAYLIVSGIELIASRALDSRSIFTIGLAFIAGISIMLMPQLADLAPPSLRFLASNGIIVAGVTAISLNLLFRLGITQRASQRLDPDDNAPLSQQIVNFVESNGAIWSARRDAIRRAAAAALEATEAIQAAQPGCQPTKILGYFDEFNLDFKILHSGPPLPLNAGNATHPANLLDLDDDAFSSTLDRTLSNLSHVLLSRLADRVSSGADENSSWLRLHFNH